jgi:Fic family protein
MSAIVLSKFKSGIWEKQYEYESFLPNLIDSDWTIDNNDVLDLLSRADRKLGELNAFATLIPDIDFFIKMHITKEATLSSKIEGTQTHVEEALMKEQDINPEKRDDWSEVQNYIHAINEAISLLETLPISNRLLKQTHLVLLDGVRGKHKQPGAYRTSQNWIGGASIKDATFIPPHPDKVENLMADLEKFINKQAKLPPLIKAAIAHYQFETIHPFLDGNGRLGRLLIVLYLVNAEALQKPALYLSAFFEKNNALYYTNLTHVRTNNDMTQWLKFFLVGIYETAENSINTFKAIIQLKQSIESELLITLGKKSVLGGNYLMLLFKHPVLDASDTSAMLEVSITTANRLIADFTRLGILKEISGFKRNRIFAFEKYISLFS